jgi:hypothetical protein
VLTIKIEITGPLLVSIERGLQKWAGAEPKATSEAAAVAAPPPAATLPPPAALPTVAVPPPEPPRPRTKAWMED